MGRACVKQLFAHHVFSALALLQIRAIPTASKEEQRPQVRRQQPNRACPTKDSTQSSSATDLISAHRCCPGAMSSVRHE